MGRPWPKKKRRKKLKKKKARETSSSVQCFRPCPYRGSFVPENEESLPVIVKGKGRWKKWTPGATLRAGFADENGACHQTAAHVDGARHQPAVNSRFVVAGAVLAAQARWMSDLKQTSLAEKQALVVHNMMFDESSFESRPIGQGDLETHSILCS